MKLWPSLAPYEYGFRVILFTYCLIVVSGYRMSLGNPIRTAMDRLYSIAIGGFVAVFVNVLVFPIWAGEQLHKELVNNFNSVADSLEGNLIKLYILYQLLSHEKKNMVIGSHANIVCKLSLCTCTWERQPRNLPEKV